MALCTCTTANGAACQVEARRGTDYCFFHDPESKQARHQAQSRGGSKKPSLRPLSPPPSDFILSGPKDILKLIEYTANRILHGELDSKTAYGLGYLADCALRAYNAGPLAERLDRIEQLLKAEHNIPVGRPEYMDVKFPESSDHDDDDDEDAQQEHEEADDREVNEVAEPSSAENPSVAEEVHAMDDTRQVT